MVTQLVAGGVDWRTVSGRAGHADGHMTLGTYAHFQQAQDRKAADFIDRLFSGGCYTIPLRSLREERGMAATSINCLAAVLKELRWSYGKLIAELRRHAAIDGIVLPKTESLIPLISRWVTTTSSLRLLSGAAQPGDRPPTL
jgi:hypothetical protein